MLLIGGNVSTQTKRVSGHLLDLDSKEIISEAAVEILLISPSDPADIPLIKGTLILKGYKPEFHDKVYILKLNDGFSDRVRITLQPLYNAPATRFDVWFEGSSWHTSIEWFNAL
jgi:hypothetical protein